MIFSRGSISSVRAAGAGGYGPFRDWSLITGRGGGGACEVLPLRKGGRAQNKF